jgi:hypothetical protein
LSWIAEAQTEDFISDNEDDSIKNGEQPKPKQVSLARPSPKYMHDDGSRAKRCDHTADNKNSYRASHVTTLSRGSPLGIENKSRGIPAALST